MQYSDTIIRPIYYRIVERRGKVWAFKEGKPFANLFNAPDLDREDLFTLFDTSMENIAAELRRINGAHITFKSSRSPIPISGQGVVA